MIEIMCLAAMGLALAFFLRFGPGDHFSPWVLTVGTWLAVLLGIQAYTDQLYPLTQQFYTCLSLWMPIMCGSALATYLLLPAAPQGPQGALPAHLREMSVNDMVFNLLFLASCVLTPMYVWRILKIVTMFDLTDMFYNIRILAVEGNENYGFLTYSYIINQALLVVAMWRWPRLPLWKLAVVIVANLLSFVAIMEKGCLFFAIVTILFVLFEKRVIRLRAIFITVAVAIALMFAINMLRTEDGDTVGGDMSFLDFIALYVLSPPVAFGKVTVDLSGQAGAHTFGVVYLFLQRFGLDVEVFAKTQEFVWVPIPTNVYTIFQPFYQDFGYAGVAFFGLVYGCLSGLAYRAFRNGSAIGRCLYTYLVYALLFQYYQENLFANIVMIGQFIFFVVIMLQEKVRLAGPALARPKS